MEAGLKFLDEKAARIVIAKRVADSRRCRLAVAFWGAGAADRLGLSERSAETLVICNLAMGGTNPAEIEALLSLGIKVTQADDLHAKVYLFDDAVIIGSSNASSNGLSFQEADGLGWREANVLVEDPLIVRTVEDWMSRLQARPITDEDLEAAKAAWRQRRSQAPPPPSTPTLLEMLRNNPGYFVDREAWLLLYMDPTDNAVREVLDDIRAAEGDSIEGFQSFPGLPDRGQTMGFWVGERGGLTFDHYWERTPQLTDRPLKDGELQLVRAREDVIGLRYEAREKPQWTQLVERLVASPFWNSEHRCAAIRMEDVARFVEPPPARRADPRLDQFHEAMLDIYHRTFAETGYRASDLFGMLASREGLLVAKSLLAGQPSSGFWELCRQDRLDLTVESLILKPEWRGLFADGEIATAERRLRAVRTPPTGAEG